MRFNEAMDFGPKNAAEGRIFAEETFRVDVQIAIHELMESKGVTQRELAKRMDVSEARVSQMFSDNCNITVRTLARVYHALGATPQITAVLGANTHASTWHKDESTDSANISSDELKGFALVLGSRPKRYATPDVKPCDTRPPKAA